MDEICQDDQWFEQAFTYMNQHDIPLSNDKKLHVTIYNLFYQSTSFLLTFFEISIVLWTFQTSYNWRL
jgi:hypothetical protein